MPYADPAAKREWDRRYSARRAKDQTAVAGRNEKRRARTAANLQAYRDAHKAWRVTHPESVRAAVAKWRQRNPERVALTERGKWAVKEAIKQGRLVRQNQCEQCGVRCKPDAAHYDYSADRLLDVRWLCVICHRQWDRLEPKTLLTRAAA